MGRPPKSVEIIEKEKKSHRTKAEIETRRKAEAASLTGIKMKEAKDVRENEAAHSEYRRVHKILEAVGKNDALYESVINEYARLMGDIVRYTVLRQELENAEDISAKDRFGLILDCDKRIDNYKKKRFEIEKENGMTIASSLRAIPKKPEEKKNPLLEALTADD